MSAPSISALTVEQAEELGRAGKSMRLRNQQRELHISKSAFGVVVIGISVPGSTGEYTVRLGSVHADLDADFDFDVGYLCSGRGFVYASAAELRLMQAYMQGAAS